MRQPTETDTETLRYIRWHITRRNAPPSRAEIAARFGISEPAAQKRLQTLAAKGIIALDHYRPRGIRILKRQCTACEQWFDETVEHYEITNGVVRSQCRVCRKSERKQRYHADPQKFIAAARDWESRNPERKRQYSILISRRYRLNQKRRRIEAMTQSIRRTP